MKLLLDFLGSVTSLTCTYLFTRVNNLAWPIGIIAFFINGFLYWQKGIYADMCLEGFYLINFLWGWHKWSKTKKIYGVQQIKQLSLRQWIYTLTLAVLLFVNILYLLITYSDSTIPNIDALTTALSITAQLLLCYSFIENWIIWCLVDILYVFLFSYKALYFHVLLSIIYFSLAVLGYCKWLKLLKGQEDLVLDSAPNK